MKHFDEARDLSDLPVYGLQDEYTPGFVDAEHCHGRAQLLYASSGVMSVVAGGASFVIPPLRAIWIPSGTLHEVSCRSAVSLRTLYIDEDRTGSAARADEKVRALAAAGVAIAPSPGAIGSTVLEAIGGSRPND